MHNQTRQQLHIKLFKTAYILTHADEDLSKDDQIELEELEDCLDNASDWISGGLLHDYLIFNHAPGMMH